MNIIEDIIKKYCELADLHFSIARESHSWKYVKELHAETEIILAAIENKSFETAINYLNIAEVLSIEEKDNDLCTQSGNRTFSGR